jgi:hypothetical protein
LPQFLDRQSALDVDDAIAVPQYPCQLLLDVTAQRGRELDVMTTEVDLHHSILLWLSLA